LVTKVSVESGRVQFKENLTMRHNGSLLAFLWSETETLLSKIWWLPPVRLLPGNNDTKPSTYGCGASAGHQ
jgi:hypothetical protein